jgi:hypothetical protein
MVRTRESDWTTHQHLLELFYGLIGNADPVDLSDLIADMQRTYKKTEGETEGECGPVCGQVYGIFKKCTVPCLWIIPPCMIRATMQWFRSFIFRVMP